MRSGKAACRLPVEPGGLVVYVTGGNVTEEAGVARVRVGCDGLIDVDTASFFGLRLTESLALLPNNRALLFGGQVTGFEPRDDDDVRLLQLGAGRPSVVGTFDIFTDFMNATRIGAAPDGSFAVLPNSSSFSDEAGDIVVADIAGNVVTERGRLRGFVTASEAVVAPDGTVAAVTQRGEDAVLIVDVRGPGAPTLATTIAPVGLAEQMAMVRTGPFAGRVFIPEVNPAGGSFVTAVDLGSGTGTRRASFALGDGSENMPVGVALQP